MHDKIWSQLIYDVPEDRFFILAQQGPYQGHILIMKMAMKEKK